MCVAGGRRGEERSLKAENAKVAAFAKCTFVSRYLSERLTLHGEKTKTGPATIICNFSWPFRIKTGYTLLIVFIFQMKKLIEHRAAHHFANALVTSTFTCFVVF
jgi:hypothetical protein